MPADLLTKRLLQTQEVQPSIQGLRCAWTDLNKQMQHAYRSAQLR